MFLFQICRPITRTEYYRFVFVVSSSGTRLQSSTVVLIIVSHVFKTFINCIPLRANVYIVNKVKQLLTVSSLVNLLAFFFQLPSFNLFDVITSSPSCAAAKSHEGSCVYQEKTSALGCYMVYHERAVLWSLDLFNNNNSIYLNTVKRFSKADVVMYNQ